MTATQDRAVLDRIRRDLATQLAVVGRAAYRPEDPGVSDVVRALLDGQAAVLVDRLVGLCSELIGRVEALAACVDDCRGFVSAWAVFPSGSAERAVHDQLMPRLERVA